MIAIEILAYNGKPMTFEEVPNSDVWVWVYGLTSEESMALWQHKRTTNWLITDYLAAGMGRTPQEAYENLMANYQKFL